MTKKISRVNAMFTKEFTISATAVHNVRVKFPPEFCSGFSQDPGKVGDFSQGVSERRKISSRDLVVTELAILDDMKVIATNCCNQESGAGRRGAFVDMVFNKVK